MKAMRSMFAVLIVTGVPTAYLFAQQPAAPAGQPAARQPMSFFITSVGKGDGANLGGLAGADAHCAALAKAANAPGDWKAYLSTQGAGAVSARDRIGKGPWHNFRGQVISTDIGILHGDTIEQARIGNPLGKQLALTEKGELVNGVGDKPNQTTSSRVRLRTAVPTPIPPTTPVITGRATAPVRRSSGIATSRAAATAPGTQPMQARAAARTT